MRPPAARNFVPESRKTQEQRRPRLQETQPRFTPAHMMSADLKKFTVLDQLAYAGQNPHGRMSLPLREVGELKRVHMGTGRSFNSSSVAAKPPRGLGKKEIGADMVHRTGTAIHITPNYRPGAGPVIRNY
jgi:hypothetical protein